MGGEWGKIAASDVIKRKEEEVVEWEKMTVKESECLNWQALFLFLDPELII